MPVVVGRAHLQTSTLPPPLATSIAPNGRYFLDQYNNPFLIVGTSESTVTNISVSDMRYSLATRVSQGFNWGLASVVGSQASQSTTGSPDWSTFDNIVPFYQSDGVTLGTGPANYDITQPYQPYWNRIDALFQMSQSMGMTLFVTLLGLTWSEATTQFAQQGNTKLAAYATWFANRYKSYTYHHLWGYDHFTTNSGGWAASDPYILIMANAVRAVNSKPLHTIENNDGVWTVNTPNLNLTSDDTAWSMAGGANNTMDLNWCYTAEDNCPDFVRAYNFTGNSSANIPVFFGEGLFDSAPSGKNTWSNFLNRKYLYYPMVNGACGSFYGHNTTWFYGSGWQADLSDTAVTHIGIWKNFYSTIPWWRLVPDQSNTYVTSGYPTSGYPVTSRYGVNACLSSDGHLGLVYVVANQSVTVAMNKMTGPILARWFDPTNGTFTFIGNYTNTGSQAFSTSSNNAAGDPDWLLVLSAS